MTSQLIFDMNNIAKDINFLSSLDRISGMRCTRIIPLWSNNLRISYVHRLHDGLVFLRHSVVNMVLVK